MRKPQEVKLSQHEREELERWTRNPTLSERQRWRAHMLLLAHEGKDDTAIAGELSRSRQWCRNIRGRFLAEGLQALAKDRPRRGRPKQIDDQRVITLTKDTPPPPAMVWTRARMAKKAGVSASSVGRIWRQNGIHWHQFTPLKLSGDPRFSEKLEAVVGFCLAPPILALVLCVDRNRRIEALTRLPLPQGQRPATTTLSAALETLGATILSTGQSWPHHRELLRFLQQIATQTPAGERRELIIGINTFPPPPKVTAWLHKHQCIFNCQYPNFDDGRLFRLARFFQGLSKRPLRLGMIESMVQLQAAITDYIAAPKDVPKPFIWTAKVADFRAKAPLDRIPE